MIRDCNKMKNNHLFFLLRYDLVLETVTKNKMNDANTKKLKGTLKYENNIKI